MANFKLKMFIHELIEVPYSLKKPKNISQIADQLTQFLTASKTGLKVHRLYCFRCPV